MSEQATHGQRSAVSAWASSGAMALTGPPDRRGLGPPARLVPGLDAAAAVLRDRSSALGVAIDVDPLVLLVERAAIGGLGRRGQTSCGGATRLLPDADGWVAVSLARPDDVDLVPAWAGLGGPPADPWAAVADHVSRHCGDVLIEQARELGLPVAVLPTGGPAAPDAPMPLAPLPVRAELLADAPSISTLEGILVIDLGSLWAGPLCGGLLSSAGAAVVKVESNQRPDGSRRGPAAFFDLLNVGKRSVALDLSGRSGQRLLAELLALADVVIEASRPRALEQLGIDARDLLRSARPRVWASLTAHGRLPPEADRVGFGDDAAVGGGLVVWDGDQPYFCADAVADPSSGLVTAAAILDALSTGGLWLLDVAMSGVAAHLAGPTLEVRAGVHGARPTARPSQGSAPALGAHTAEVLDELGLG